MKAIGLMSGTSMDGIDVALIETDGETIDAFGPQAAFSYDEPERYLLREAMDSARGIYRRDDRTGVLGLAENMVTAKHAQCVKDFAAANAIDLASVDVIGFHGQTVIHRPEKGFTVQLGDGKALSQVLGAPVVYDLRAADMAHGGHGAPLVPIFHRALAQRAGLPLPAAFVNIGGISNVTFVPEGPAEGLVAFDAGPGNCLLDDWTMRHTGEPIDRDAKLALSGAVNRETLTKLLSHPYFSAPLPKSLDRSTFSLDQLGDLSAADGAATLTAFTVAGIGASVRLLPAQPKVWIVAGGGVRNPYMLAGLRKVLQPRLETADSIGSNADFVEAQAFAYLAARKIKQLPSSFPGTTGTREPAIGGVLVGGRA